MLLITDGVIVDAKVKNKIQPSIEKGSMAAVNGIIVHQTGGSSVQSALESYTAGGNGAHLLIDKDGTIYQTAHVNKITWHVGKLQSRCVQELKCPDPKKWDPSGTNKTETAKSWPERYPSNNDSLGIELVGLFDAKAKQYENVTAKQNASLKWLIDELQATLCLVTTEVFRHPQVSYKEPSEASSANWK